MQSDARDVSRPGEEEADGHHRAPRRARPRPSRGHATKIQRGATTSGRQGKASRAQENRDASHLEVKEEESSDEIKGALRTTKTRKHPPSSRRRKLVFVEDDDNEEHGDKDDGNLPGKINSLIPKGEQGPQHRLETGNPVKEPLLSMVNDWSLLRVFDTDVSLVTRSLLAS